MSRSSGSGCLVAVCRCGTFVQLMRLVHVGGIIDEQMKLTPVLLSRRQLAVCMVERKIS